MKILHAQHLVARRSRKDAREQRKMRDNLQTCAEGTSSRAEKPLGCAGIQQHARQFTNMRGGTSDGARGHV